MAKTVSAPFGLRIPQGDLDLIDSAIAANPGLYRTKIFRAAIERFILSDDFLQLTEGQIKSPA